MMMVMRMMTMAMRINIPTVAASMAFAAVEDAVDTVAIVAITTTGSCIDARFIHGDHIIEANAMRPTK